MQKNFCDYRQSSICLVSCHSNRLCSWFNLEDMHLKEHKFRLTYWCGKYVIWKKTTLRVFVAIWRWMSTMILIQWSKQEQIICWWLCNGYIQVRDHPYITSAKGLGRWGQKMAIFTDVQYCLCWRRVGGSEKVQKCAAVIWGWSVSLKSFQYRGWVPKFATHKSPFYQPF